ncbi:MAG: hypothetical protein LUH19_08940 [Lachnospiraceae bacterium]|nr:hypothetical protein [Lachnospiraceae bacterium]
MNKSYLQKAINVAWPAVVESFFVALVGLIDSFMVSRVGAYAVAAVGLTTQPKFIGLAVFIAINTSVYRKPEGRRRCAVYHDCIHHQCDAHTTVGVIFSGLSVGAGHRRHLAGSSG